jgi:hypothetical protein
MYDMIYNCLDWKQKHYTNLWINPWSKRERDDSYHPFRDQKDPYTEKVTSRNKEKCR